MKRLPEEREPELVGWFAACLMLSLIVVAAFLLLGDIGSPAKAHLVALPEMLDEDLTVTAGCQRPADSGREICPPKPGKETIVVAEPAAALGVEPRL